MAVSTVGGDTTMTYLLLGALAIWLFGLYFLASLNAQDAETVLENLAADQRYVEVPASPWRAQRTVLGWLLDSVFYGPILAAAMHLFGRTLNLDGADGSRVTKIDPTRLTEAGRAHLTRAIRNERIKYGWMAAGCVLLVYAAYYFSGWRQTVGA